LHKNNELVQLRQFPYKKQLGFKVIGLSKSQKKMTTFYKTSLALLFLGLLACTNDEGEERDLDVVKPNDPDSALLEQTPDTTRTWYSE